MLDRWKNDELVGIDCLIRNDGTAVIFNCRRMNIGGNQHNICLPIGDSTIESLEKYNDDIWTGFQAYTECIDDESGNIYLGGEGGMGNEGFIACLNSERLPIWAIFLVNSNPFYEVTLNNGKIEGQTSLDLKYIIDIEFPEKIKIEYCEWS